MRYRVTDIKWDIDEPCDVRQFPKTITVDTDGGEVEIANLLLDEYGFHVTAFKATALGE